MNMYLGKIKSLDAAKAECDRIKRLGKRVVFTNGCFDILHPGHTRYLCSNPSMQPKLNAIVSKDWGSVSYLQTAVLTYSTPAIPVIFVLPKNWETF